MPHQNRICTDTEPAAQNKLCTDTKPAALKSMSTVSEVSCDCHGLGLVVPEGAEILVFDTMQVLYWHVLDKRQTKIRVRLIYMLPFISLLATRI